MARRQAGLIAALALLAPAALAGGPDVSWKRVSEAPFLPGVPFLVQVEISAPDGGADVPTWMLEAAAFHADGKPLGKRGSSSLQLAPGAKIALEFDLGPALQKADAGASGPFQLGFADDKQKSEVVRMNPVKKADFLKMAPEELAKYQVIMETNRGSMTMAFWPDVAPDHVRNFLDLCATGFYDGTTFHRVIPGFMIQGGDPTGTGTGSGPRRLKAEFNNKKHEPGVLSMARSQDPNSASCQFFVMHATSPHLDGQYSAFGKLTSGLDVVEKIVNTPRGPGDKPNQTQTIVRATVVLPSGK